MSSRPRNREKEHSHTGDERVGCRLQTAQPITDNEDARAECTEVLGLDSRDAEQRPEGIQPKPPQEYSFVAVMPKDPGGVTDGSDGVCTVFRLRQFSVFCCIPMR